MNPIVKIGDRLLKNRCMLIRACVLNRSNRVFMLVLQ